MLVLCGKLSYSDLHICFIFIGEFRLMNYSDPLTYQPTSMQSSIKDVIPKSFIRKCSDRSIIDCSI